MYNLKELEVSEMIEISGGVVNPAYELGYAIGTCLRQIILIQGLCKLFY
jgi:hypothetical protein